MNKLVLIANDTYENYENLSRNIPIEIECINKTFEKIGYEASLLYNRPFSDLCNELHSNFDELKNDDNIIIYYTGHGYYKDGHHFIICPDSKTQNTSTTPMFLATDYKYYDIQLILNYKFKTSKVLLVFNACRTTDNQLHLYESDYDAKENGPKPFISQLYSTTLLQASYNNNVFCEAFCEACTRYKFTLTEIYEFLKNIMDYKFNPQKPQLPVFILGNENFEVANELTEVVEKKIYDDVIKTYQTYLKSYENFDQNTTADLVYENGYPLDEVALPRNKTKDIIQIFLNNKKFGFIGGIISLSIYSLVVEKYQFKIYGENGTFTYKNEKLYVYEDIVEVLDNNSRIVYNKSSKIILDHIFYENCYENAIPTQFELRIENAAEKSLDHYVKSDDFRQMLYTMVEKNRGFLISSPLHTDCLGFLKTIVNNYIDHSDKILFLSLMQVLSKFENVENKFINELWMSNETDIYVNKIRKHYYKWIIVSAHASTKVSDKEHFEEIEKIVKAAHENGIPIICLTNYMASYKASFHHNDLVKMFIPVIDSIIYLEKDRFPINTFIAKIDTIDEYLAQSKRC